MQLSLFKPIVVLFSGGMGSFLTAWLLKQQRPESEIVLFFNDTIIEDNDHYRFTIESVCWLNGVKKQSTRRLLKELDNLPELGNNDRAPFLYSLFNKLECLVPSFIYDADGRDVWQVFEDVKYLGNTRVDPCSRVLKRERSAKGIMNRFGSVDVAIGIDWTEIHRYHNAKPVWAEQGLNLIAPLAESLADKQQLEAIVLEISGIQRCRLYDYGFSHSNCGGFCVKAGLAHFKNLLIKMPERYLWHELKEQELILKCPKVRPFLRKTIDGVLHYWTLREYRTWLQENELSLEDSYDFAGCGCAI
jgi:hypothetical protein